MHYKLGMGPTGILMCRRVSTKEQHRRECARSTRRLINVINHAIINRVELDGPHMVSITACITVCPGFDADEVTAYIRGHGLPAEVRPPDVAYEPETVHDAPCGKKCFESKYCGRVLFSIPYPEGWFETTETSS